LNQGPRRLPGRSQAEAPRRESTGNPSAVKTRTVDKLTTRLLTTQPQNPSMAEGTYHTAANNFTTDPALGLISPGLCPRTTEQIPPCAV